MPLHRAIGTGYRWLLPASVTLVLFVLMNLAKDNAPWPIHIGAAAAFLACVGWTMLVHHQGRAVPRVESSERR